MRRLHRGREAQTRIDAAFRLLRETKDYPAERISPDDEVQAVVRAWADHFGDTGQAHRAAAMYHELLEKLLSWKIDPDNGLSHAMKLSQIYAALAGLEPANAAAMSARRLELWRHWDAKLPGNAFVQRQLASAMRAAADAASGAGA